MSMRNYAVDAYGLLIDDAAVRYVARNLKKNNVEELGWDDIANAEEVRQGTENLLPQNFDYRGHLRHVIGTYLG